MSNIPVKSSVLVEVGDLVQITNRDHDWYRCILVVDQVKSWGIQAGMQLPPGVHEVACMPDNTTYLRIPNGDYEIVGKGLIKL